MAEIFSPIEGRGGKYEVLAEHKHLAAGQQLLSTMPGRTVDL